MSKPDYANLEVERARISVSIEEARNLVTQWMGADFSEKDDQLDVKVNEGLSTTVGLGYKPQPAQDATAEAAFMKLKRLQAKKAAAASAGSQHATSGLAPAKAAQASATGNDDADDDDESRSRMKPSQRRLARGGVSKLSRKKLKSFRKKAAT